MLNSFIKPFPGVYILSIVLYMVNIYNLVDLKNKIVFKNNQRIIMHCLKMGYVVSRFCHCSKVYSGGISNTHLCCVAQSIERLTLYKWRG